MSLTNLQNLTLNILKETKHNIVQDIVVTELPSCKLCENKILFVNFELFTILSCGHTYYRKCIEKNFLLTTENKCPLSDCNKIIDPVVSERRFSKSSSQSSGTSALTKMLGDDFGLGSPMAVSPLLGQKDPPLCETEGSHNNNPILIESKTQKKHVSDASNKSSSKKARKQVKKEDSPTLKKLISELTTDASEISKLNDNITHVESKNESTNQELIQCYYSFGDSLSMRINYYKNLKHGDLTSQALVNEEVREQIGEKISNDTLRKRTEKAWKIYALFNSIFKDRGKEMIVCIKTFSASSISKLSWEEIEYVIARVIRSNQ
ncbi:10024_t:CDS:2 [Cetraspora pellucida]|uniref:10024_t:CDS:1 n=1 Tax=Cetraspora pellucida TaxID=1433469 RepID=A0A9N9B946_9GLOM|nr:10024_t:CDS:2 [Cetraspora pellucida]